MTKEEIIEAATFCAKNEECKDCKFCGIGCCTTEFAKYITGQKNEPACECGKQADSQPSKDDTNKHFDNNTLKEICQEAFNKADLAVKAMLTIYENMTATEQRAFDLGETYRSMIDAFKELEEVVVEEDNDDGGKNNSDGL